MRWNLTFAAVFLGMTLSGMTADAPPARAQDIPNDSFGVNRFSPAPGPGNYLMVDGTLVGAHGEPSAGLLIDFAHRPFVLLSATCKAGATDDCSVEKSKHDIVAYQLTFDAMATLALWQRLQLGLVVPIIISRGESFPIVTPDLAGKYIDIRGGNAFGLGDPRFSAKLRLTGQKSRFGLALVGFVTAPLGEATAKGRSLGDDGVTAGGHLAAELGGSRLRVGINVGGRYRPSRALLSTEVGPELTYGAGVSLYATPRVRLIGEVTGANRLRRQLDENPVEARIAGEWIAGDVAVLLGLGSGLVSGVGVPDIRLLGGLSYRPQGLADADGDGVPDKSDACPNEREDQDGFQDADGCPDPDNDGDGIPDLTDRCPDQPEDFDGFQDRDGCPDPDNDGDGIPDGYDTCPDQPEDKDGDRDDDGCPDNDRDRDGIPDDVDKCPDSPEDTDGFGDEDGCPEVDFDNDNIPDDEDKCPEQPEDRNGYQDADGCPDAIPPPARPSHRRHR
jgi:hypothetical protein